MISKEQYLKSPGVCPRCGSWDISGLKVEIDGDTSTQDVSCSDCDLCWTDVYTLSDIIIDDDPWEECKSYPREDWQYQVANGDTNRGYWDYVLATREMDEDHKKKCYELIDAFAINLKAEVERFYNCGGIDTDSYDPESYKLAMLLVTAAIRDNQYYFNPQGQDRAEIDNLLRF